MPCYHPIPAYQDRPGQQPRLNPPLGTENLALPCGTCVGCKTARATQWAHRCAHEATRWAQNTFITLTYDDENLPKDGHLQPEALQRFFKRLRKNARRTPDEPIRYFACGEYGTKTGRPHYHAILFNYNADDKYPVGKDLYASENMAKLWPLGTHKLGDATPAAANYIAQYALNKQTTGDYDSDGVYKPAPFLRMSRKPAIGSLWLREYNADLTHGYLLENARKHSIPRTYLTRLKKEQPQLHEEIQIRKQQYITKNKKTEQETKDRLKDQEIIHTQQKQQTERRRTL